MLRILNIAQRQHLVSAGLVRREQPVADSELPFCYLGHVTRQEVSATSRPRARLLPAIEVERRAVDAGLLDLRMPIGKSKTFRTARSALGVKTQQQPGKRAGGWIWSLPNEAPSDAQRPLPSPTFLDGAISFVAPLHGRG